MTARLRLRRAGERSARSRPFGCLRVALAAALAFAAAAQPAAPVRASTQMVVTANRYASEAGREILRAGGGAVDAAIAVQLVLSLVEPQSSGIGGGAFMLVLRRAVPTAASPVHHGVRGPRDRAAAATPDMFLDENGRPGVVRRRRRRRARPSASRASCACSSSRIASMAGCRGRSCSSPRSSSRSRASRCRRGCMRCSTASSASRAREDFRRYFYDAAGEPRPVGYRLKNPEYAATLRLLAAQGAEPMYSGELAAAIAREVRENNVRAGPHDARRPRRATARTSPEPLCSPYRTWRVCGPQLPSSGGVTTQQMLGMLSALRARRAARRSRARRFT